MRPGERNAKRVIRRRHHRDFELSERLLATGHDVHSQLCEKEVKPFQQRAKIVAVGLWTKMCKQYRAVIVLCELGLVADAQVVVRSLFESTLWTLFVVKRNARLIQGWQHAPPPPRGSFSMHFRAELYLARYALHEQKRLNIWKRKAGCKRLALKLAKPVEELVAGAESNIGTAWTTWLRRKSSHAFSVETMATNLQLGPWYELVYRPQSVIAHAGDAISHLDLGAAPFTIDDRLSADIEGVPGQLHLASFMFGKTAEVINHRFHLGFHDELKDLAVDLADGARTVLGST